MRSWLARSVPPAHARAAVAAFTSPRLTRILLDLPEAARRDSSAFDEALGTDGLRLRAAGPMDRVSVGVRVHQMVTRRIDRVRGAHRVARITRRWGGGVDHGTVQTLRSLFDEVGTFAARAVMGEVWWSDSWDKAAYSPDVRRQLWNALAVDLLAQRAPAEG